MKVRFYDFLQNLDNELELANIKEVELDTALLNQVVKSIEANKRAGTRATKSRGDVKGGGRKPWPQKHTGRARHSTIRSPLWIKGGHTFALEPGRPYLKLNSKIKKNTLLDLLSFKAGEGHICLVDAINIDVPSTSQAQSLISKLGLKGHKIAFITSDSKENVFKSFRNLKDIEVIPVDELNIRHLLLNNKLVFEYEAYRKLTERS